MYEVRIVRITGEEERVLKTVETHNPNLVIVYQGETKPVVSRYFETFRKDETHYYQQIYAQIVDKLVSKYPEYISHINKDRIGFLVDDKWEPQSQATENSIEYINIKRANKETKLYLGFDYEIIMKQYYLEKWDNSQLAAAILSTLLRIDATKGTIKNYGERFQSRLVATFGINYLDDDVSIPNVLEELIHLGHFEKADRNVNGQIGIDELPIEDDFADGEIEADQEDPTIDGDNQDKLLETEEGNE